MLMHDDLAHDPVFAFAGIVDGDRVARLEGVVVNRRAGFIDNGDLVVMGEGDLLVFVRRIGDAEAAVGIRVEAAIEMIRECGDRESERGENDGEEEFFHDGLAVFVGETSQSPISLTKFFVPRIYAREFGIFRRTLQNQVFCAGASLPFAERPCSKSAAAALAKTESLALPGVRLAA